MKAKVPRLAELVDARVSVFRPLQVGDYGFIATVNGVMIGKVTYYIFESTFFNVISCSRRLLFQVRRQKRQTL